MKALYLSAYLSLAIQLITGLIESKGLLVLVNPEDFILQDILTMELIVQGIEFVFYSYLVYKLVSGSVSKEITSQRYFDWFLTTPTMLVSFALFFKYLQSPSRGIRFVESFQEEVPILSKILIANALMLLFGYLGETGILPQGLGVAIGFVPFAYIFKQLYSNYVKENNATAKKLFYFSFGVWSLYGVAAMLPFSQKNTMYNILDLFAKNAYGLFLYFFIRSKAIPIDTRE